MCIHGIYKDKAFSLLSLLCNIFFHSVCVCVCVCNTLTVFGITENIPIYSSTGKENLHHTDSGKLYLVFDIHKF